MPRTPKTRNVKTSRPRTGRGLERTLAKTPTSAERSPIERVYYIHDRVKSGELPNCSDLAEDLRVTTKTVQRDINFMRDHLGLPMVYDDKRHGFFYQGNVDDFPSFELSAEEVAVLFLARCALVPVRGTKLGGILDKAFQKIVRPMTDKFTFEWADLDDALSLKQTGATAELGEAFSKLAKAVLDRREVEFGYRKIGADKEETRRVQPYHLGEIDNGWYLIGYDLDRKAMRTFALPRVGKTKVLISKFHRPREFNAGDYLRHSFGVWKEDGEGQPVDVRVEFTGYAARLVAERQWHETQEVKELNAGGTKIEVRLKLANLTEVTRWVLSWGSMAKVVSPPELVKAVRDEAQAIVARK
jgi:predicted DNA-binding transcriptional regulator YafY